MNNYCTNCGTRLGSKDLACKNCGTPVVDLPIGYRFKTKAQKEKQKKTITILVAVFVTVVVLAIMHEVALNLKIKSLQNKYVLPYVVKTYNVNNPKIKFKEAGRCIISGDCYINLGSGCDQSYCEEYRFLSRFKCKSYYYNVFINGKEYTITVFKKDGKYNVVTGKNIYGLDEEQNDGTQDWASKAEY